MYTASLFRRYTRLLIGSPLCGELPALFVTLPRSGLEPSVSFPFFLLTFSPVLWRLVLCVPAVWPLISAGKRENKLDIYYVSCGYSGRPRSWLL
jgi:hypothetical protein